MGRLKSDLVILTIALAFCFVQAQYFLQSPQPLYFVQESGQSAQTGSDSDELINPNNQFQSRKGVPPPREAESDEDDDEDEDSVEETRPMRPGPRQQGTQGMRMPGGRTRPVHLPPGFDESVKRKMQLTQRPKRPLHGDPSPINQDEDEEGRRPESRLLWPFSIEITKGGDKGGWGGPEQYGSYTSWASNGWGGQQGSGWGGGGGSGATSHPYNYGWGEEKGLTDEQILKSKHYKKYQKKKKKKIKKLKKKLKFKRLIQKILQKHITYLDKIAPY